MPRPDAINPVRGRCRSLVAALVLIFVLAGALATAQTEDREVPHGVAGDWVVGHRLLLEGRAADALPYLHMAYRAQPDIPSIAMDFQAALAAEGYLRDAINVVDQLVEAYPDSMSYRLRRSALNLQAGQQDKALKDLRILRDQGHSTPEVLGAEARLLAARGDVDQALDVLRDGLHLHPEDGGLMYLDMSRILQQAGQAERIPDLMKEARTRYPDDASIWLVGIRAYAALDLHDEALALAEEAEVHFAVLESPPVPAEGAAPFTGDLEPSLEPLVDSPHTGNESFLVDLADFYAQRGQPQRAVAILEPLEAEGALGLNPSLWLARLLLGTGRYPEGSDLVDRILETWPSSGRAWYLKAKVAELNEDDAVALDHYRRATELAPSDPEIRLGIVRAMLLSWEGILTSQEATPDRDAKIEEFKDHTMAASTLVMDEDAEGQLLLGYSFRTLKDMKRAAWRFELAAENPDLRLTALLQRSICLDELGQVDKARGDLETLRREFPDNAEVANSYGYYLAEKGEDLDLAEGLITEALANDPSNGAYLDSMGWVLYRQDRLESALDYMIQAVNVLPDDPVILEHLGMVLMGLGQDVQALEALNRALLMGGDPARLKNVVSEIEARLESSEP